MNIVVRIIISAVVAFGLSYILSGIHIDTFLTALVLAIVLGDSECNFKTDSDNSYFSYHDSYIWTISICY